MYNRIAFLGDSLTKGTDYGGVTLTDLFAYKTGIGLGYAPGNIVISGQSANTSAMMLARMDTDILAQNVDVCAVMAMVNDSDKNVPLTDYAANLRAIVAKLRGASIKPVLLSPPLWRGNELAHSKNRTYLETLRAVAAELDVDFIDCWQHYAFDYLCDVAEYVSRYSPDDLIHQSKTGHTDLANILLKPAYRKAWAPLVSVPVTESLKGLVIAMADFLIEVQSSELLTVIAQERSKLN